MIKILKVENKGSGNLKAHDVLKKIVDPQTLLALSGGRSPDYAKMIVEPVTPLRSAGQSFEGQSILPGAICVVDERYGQPFHQDSNELLFKNFGVIDYCDRKNIEFRKILEGKGIEQTSEDYDQLMSELFVKFPKKVGVMGIGANLHTAGLFPHTESLKSAKLATFETVDDIFSQRISMTLKAFGEFHNFVILAFGSEKREALKKVLDESENDMQAYPAIFYRKCFAKCYLITDQNIK